MGEVHIEVKQAVVRRYADKLHYADADPFNLVCTLDFIGRSEAQISADLACPDNPITRADLRELRRQLVADYAVRRLYCWRIKDAAPPYPGRILREDGPLVYWEMVL
ncbi:hypothetical protein PL263_10415 [Methylomonas sp. EFPC3]|uniref:hypothetical protein n=1 Tax=Methylomonas sp. EFPC3 TaxID=3021710 RepID=UPI0024172463|nr:hypothetical protein [Methylomonas sp. EFPC3]WFP48526.1 hypothetical protein PL263_10415 [Methylomonas sp. EFPC3]